MPSLTEVQNTAITLMDYIYFHDIASLSTDSPDKEMFFSYFSKAIDDIIFARKYQGKMACLYQHYLLCIIEISSNIPCPMEVKNFNTKLEDSIELLQKVESSAEKHGFDVGDLHQDRNALSEYFEFSVLPESFLYKLVTQYLYFKYGLLSIVVFNKFLDLGLLKSNRYRSELKKERKYNSDDVFLSILLFVEFETDKKRLYIESEYKNESVTIYFNESVEKINDVILFVQSINRIKSRVGGTYESVADIDINSKKCIESYIKQLEAFLSHNILFFKSLPLCVGLMGSWFVNHLKAKSANRAIHTQPPSENIVEENSCTVEAKELMLSYGFLLYEPRTFNDHYNKFRSHYKRIQNYFRSSSERQIGVFTPDVINYYRFITN